jgi:hypothetical protein
MFYIQKLNNCKPTPNWEYYTAHRYGDWAHFICFAKGYDTRQEAEDRLAKLGLVEEKGKIRIIEKK